MDERKAANRDLDIAYSIEGRGPPVILIPGLGASAQSTWGGVTPFLTADKTVVCPDLRGTGDSDAGPMSLRDLAGDVSAVADDAGFRRYDVIGFSLGAAVAAQFAADRPERVRSLILAAAPSVRPTGRTVLQFRLWERLLTDDIEALAQLWLLTGFSARFVSAIPPSQVGDAARFPIEGVAGAQSALAVELDYHEALARVEATTLVISCKEDCINPFDPELVTALSSCVRREQRELMCGHMAVLEVPRELATTITDFISSVD